MDGWGNCLACGEPTHEQSHCNKCSDGGQTFEEWCEGQDKRGLAIDFFHYAGALDVGIAESKKLGKEARITEKIIKDALIEMLIAGELYDDILEMFEAYCKDKYEESN